MVFLVAILSETQGKVPFMTLEGFHQLHILLFVLVVIHVIYSVMIMALGMWKVKLSPFSQSFYL
jgi:hypothetical protein